ncbi:tyrosine-type recombinase/integrase [Nonomuraea sp. NPDC049695]|uniref:tyrosine-type recombinase/integrase n=1 Tax=Nonomuraea sp. NPDC049695 TaxID=3154734 RepID=UPI003423A556
MSTAAIPARPGSATGSKPCATIATLVVKNERSRRPHGLFHQCERNCTRLLALLRTRKKAQAAERRHTAAFFLIEEGVHIRVVQEILCHTRVTTTERYAHVATLQMKHAGERMDEAPWGIRRSGRTVPRCPRGPAGSGHAPPPGRATTPGFLETRPGAGNYYARHVVAVPP